MGAEGVTLDVVASWPHYVDRLAPVWLALPADLRGTFYAAKGRRADVRAADLGVADVRSFTNYPDRKDGQPTLVASYHDLSSARRRRLALLEHGAGQSYSNRNPGYAGGRKRESVELFLVPNLHAAERDLAVAVDLGPGRRQEVRVVGDPALDRWLLDPPTPDPRCVALSWHWENTAIPEARSALDWYRPTLGRAVALWRSEGLDVIGHGHPRMTSTLTPLYAELGVEQVPDFADVVARASVYVCDNSSTMFEMAALGRSVVSLNAPWYRRDVEHGLRFWSHSGIGPHVDKPADLGQVVLRAARDRPRAPETLISDVYGYLDGRASVRAAAALVGWLTGSENG